MLHKAADNIFYSYLDCHIFETVQGFYVVIAVLSMSSLTPVRSTAYYYFVVMQKIVVQAFNHSNKTLLI